MLTRTMMTEVASEGFLVKAWPQRPPQAYTCNTGSQLVTPGAPSECYRVVNIETSVILGASCECTQTVVKREVMVNLCLLSRRTHTTQMFYFSSKIISDVWLGMLHAHSQFAWCFLWNRFKVDINVSLSLSLLTLLHMSRSILLLQYENYLLLRLRGSSMFYTSNVANFSPIKSKLFVQEHGLDRTPRKDKHPSPTDDSKYKKTET